MKINSVSVLDLAREEARANIRRNIVNSERIRLLKRRNKNLRKFPNNRSKSNIISVNRHLLSKEKVNYIKNKSTSVNKSKLEVAREHARKKILDNIKKSEYLRVEKGNNKVLRMKITCLEEALYLENPCAEVPLSSLTHYKTNHPPNSLHFCLKNIYIQLFCIFVGVTYLCWCNVKSVYCMVQVSISL